MFQIISDKKCDTVAMCNSSLCKIATKEFQGIVVVLLLLLLMFLQSLFSSFVVVFHRSIYFLWIQTPWNMNCTKMYLGWNENGCENKASAQLCTYIYLSERETKLKVRHSEGTNERNNQTKTKSSSSSNNNKTLLPGTKHLKRL